MPSLDSFSWPARRWLMDRLCGHHAYSRGAATWSTQPPLRPIEGHHGPIDYHQIIRSPFYDRNPGETA